MSGAVLAALARYLGPIDVVRMHSTPWASASFAGQRHSIEAKVASDAPVDTLAEADFNLESGFVADVAVTRCGTAAGGLAVRLNVLTIDTD